MAATATTKDSREKPAHGKYLIRKAGPEKHQVTTAFFNGPALTRRSSLPLSFTTAPSGRIRYVGKLSFEEANWSSSHLRSTRAPRRDDPGQSRGDSQ